MTFDPYLHFQGNCAEAMAAYAEIFDATDLSIMRYGDLPPGPDGAEVPPGIAGADLVMHASFTAGGRMLMASDFPPGHGGDPQQGVSLHHSSDDAGTARALFDRLAEGGTVVAPFGPTFWAEGFGMVKDRFGTHWMLSGPSTGGG